MLRHFRHVLIGLLLIAPSAALSQMDGHGPDAWRVVDVAPNDVLNMRSGPGTDHLVIATLPPDATGLQLVTCVPYFSFTQFQSLSETQRANLPPRWCLVEDPQDATSGWVSARFLAEDTTVGQSQGDPLVDEAVRLVQDLYQQRQDAMEGRASDPLQPSAARRYFFPDVVNRLAEGPGADPLFDAQDAEITGLEVFPEPGNEMFRGMITVHARFENFGMPQRVVFRLRVDPSLDPPAVRIMRIEHDDWTLP
ncbi:SH3 domain-containing protein [Maritimibacter sp. HL-12]|uniref:SH3 domain-containing protein n=1 Tax=Maritimibacter sp. HL-12 TaxID=1162418 RepID=UPI000A0F2F67|nr:SH3 domain-containing protein [Maritimibacter sp. HL-12]SMH39939.1 hypothetical protein SAMN05661107_1030 [Maritimibacter sp. HL-12]